MKLTDREKRTIRIASVLVVLYLAVFYGSEGWQVLRSIEDRYEQKKAEAEQLTLRLLKEKKKQKQLRELREAIGIDLERLDGETLVGEARVAIQTIAKTHGVGLGPSKESPARSGSRDLAVIHLEGQGTVLGISKFVHGLPLLGYPMAIERLTFRPDPKKPGQMGFTLSVVVLDIEAWKSGTPGTPGTPGTSGEKSVG